MRKIWMSAFMASLALILLTASPVFGSYSMGPGESEGNENPGPPLYYIVQFEGPILEEWKDQVNHRGGEILGYIPQFAFKVRMNPAQAKAVEELDSVTGVIPYPSRAKLSRNLVLEEGLRLYRIRVERGADTGMVASAVAKSGARILRRDGEMMLVLAEGSEVTALAEIIDIARIESFKFPEKHNDGARGILGLPNTSEAFLYDGSTQIVAVADTGIGNGTTGGAHADIPADRITNIYNRSAQDELFCWDVIGDGAMDVDSGHGTHVAVSAVGDGGPSGEGMGTAPGAKLIFQAVEDYLDLYGLCEGALPDGYYLIGIPEDLGTLFRQAYDDNVYARVHSNSWGSNWFSEYTIDSHNADKFIWDQPDMTITFSAGNDGIDQNQDGAVDTCIPGGQGVAGCLMTAQAVAKNVIAVGASENDRTDGYPCQRDILYLRTLWPEHGQSQGGTLVTLYGSGFDEPFGAEPLTVAFGGNQGSDVNWVSSSEITVLTPLGIVEEPVMPVDVVVTNPDGTTATLYRAYTYISAEDPEPPILMPTEPPVSCAQMDGRNNVSTYCQLSFAFCAQPLASDETAGNSEQMAAFSSSGPAYDGRIKPDVVAPGTWVLSGYSDLYQEGYDGAVNPRNGQYQYDGWGAPFSESYKYMGGTSMSNPLVAGGAAVVRDYYQKEHGHNASAALVKATLINSAEDMLDENNDGALDNDMPIPNGREGWGRVNLFNATDGSHDFIEEPDGLSTGQSATYSFEAKGDVPFKVSLVWSDHPATDSQLVLMPGGALVELFTAPQLVNDLDLKITFTPDKGPAVTYLGNNFANGWSQTGGNPDRLNNVENVYVQNPAGGTLTVEVKGFNTPFGPQPYALVIDGVVVNAGLPPAPVADFTAAPLTGDVSLDVSFTDTSTGNVTSWSWDFGDTETSTAQNPSHIYNAAGTYTVSLTAIGPGGSDTMTRTGYITVADAGSTPTPPPPTGPTITITKANYSSRKDTLTVEATSSTGSSPALTATYQPVAGGAWIEFAEPNMGYNKRKDKWSATVNGLTTKPFAVQVCPGIGECVTVSDGEIGGK